MSFLTTHIGVLTNCTEGPLYCCIYGDMNPFPVQISRQKTVRQLKEDIVAKKPDWFQGIDADSLKLWKVDMPDG